MANRRYRATSSVTVNCVGRDGRKRLAELCPVLSDEAVVLRPALVRIVLPEVVFAAGDRDDRTVSDLAEAGRRVFLAEVVGLGAVIPYGTGFQRLSIAPPTPAGLA